MLKNIICQHDFQPRDTAKIEAKIQQYMSQPFGLFTHVFALQARIHPDKPALVCDEQMISYGELEVLSDRIAAGLQRDGVVAGGVVAICAATSIEYIATFIGILKSGAAACPLSPSSTSLQLQSMFADSRSSHLFLDDIGQKAIGDLPPSSTVRLIELLPGPEFQKIERWLPSPTVKPRVVDIDPDSPFNIIYSSGTTGTPKGIVQPHSLRWPQLHLLNPPGYGPDAVAIISTPLYSNTTLVSVLPALAGGGTLVLMSRFDAPNFLDLCVRYRVTTAMLVPVQYRRILDVSDFERFNLSSFKTKYATSSPFSAELKAEVLTRWPGGLIEYYGMTEGGGSCMLVAHDRPDKLHTVGQPIDGHQIRVIDDKGRELPKGQIGELVGRSAIMMTGYHNQPQKTRDAEWIGPAGERFIRTGDVGAIDEEGFVTLIGRKKDIIISGGINIYPVDLEAVLKAHPAVADAAVVGAASSRWGETPVGFVTLKEYSGVTEPVLKDWANEKLGKMQRLSAVRIIDDLPRNQLGKILKRELASIYEKALAT